MKRKILSVMLLAILTVIMLVGCGDSVETGGRVETGGSAEAGDSMQAVTSENGESLFPGTIFDDIEMLNSTAADVEKLFDARGLAYEESNYGFIGTTISDELYDWEAKYFCDFMIKDNYFDIDGQILTDDSYEFTEEDAVLTQWTTILFLNEDSEYRDSVKLIQSIIDQNKLDSYDALEMTYDYLKVFFRLDGFENGEVVCYPTERLEYAGIDCLKYILFGKVPNYNKDGVNHAIFFTVGIMFEEYYQEEDFLPVGLSALLTPRPRSENSSVVIQQYQELENSNIDMQLLGFGFCYVDGVLTDIKNIHDINNAYGANAYVAYLELFPKDVSTSLDINSDIINRYETWDYPFELERFLYPGTYIKHVHADSDTGLTRSGEVIEVTVTPEAAMTFNYIYSRSLYKNHGLIDEEERINAEEYCINTYLKQYPVGANGIEYSDVIIVDYDLYNEFYSSSEGSIIIND